MDAIKEHEKVGQTNISENFAPMNTGSPPVLLAECAGDNIPTLGQTPSEVAEGAQYSQKPLPLLADEALLVHYYSEHLGRWLDCTDGSRQFTLMVPREVKHCPILRYAVLSFASRHRRDYDTAKDTYQRCITLLIDRLNENPTSHSDKLLCAIVILHYCDQLSDTFQMGAGPQTGRHLAGYSAVFNGSQDQHCVDPSAPTLRETGFWVYVRQSLYHGSINQELPTLDSSLKLRPTPASIQDSHPLDRLRVETAWANQATWNAACVAEFCLNRARDKLVDQTKQWEQHWDAIQTWRRDRPIAFEPMWSGPVQEESTLSGIWFTADWHAVAFCFYHFSCLLLYIYKPGLKFAVCKVDGERSDTECQILDHARAICSSCKSSPDTVPILILLSQSAFMWAPLLFDPKERNEIISLLIDFETSHNWSTIRIVSALRSTWGMG
ncbi:hypothetical protein T440DRAFT_468198 [Plenodomus tracheiphilus IPT5]|uniref:Transcription factor domain-containing protein n=1 Tax=Plenodomus tracheiphilus IPT5 TaxID=1408161 RepID=A0A6A7B9I5_9PLEO|nr:hypothetical protein T440DRAFT_468198 [Plenodomus tracheiphilus IPT5]